MQQSIFKRCLCSTVLNLHHHLYPHHSYILSSDSTSPPLPLFATGSQRSAPWTGFPSDSESASTGSHSPGTVVSLAGVLIDAPGTQQCDSLTCCRCCCRCRSPPCAPVVCCSQPKDQGRSVTFHRRLYSHPSYSSASFYPAFFFVASVLYFIGHAPSGGNYRSCLSALVQWLLLLFITTSK